VVFFLNLLEMGTYATRYMPSSMAELVPLPKEVWHDIFHRIANSEEKILLTTTCKLFYEIIPQTIAVFSPSHEILLTNKILRRYTNLTSLDLMYNRHVDGWGLGKLVRLTTLVFGSLPSQIYVITKLTNLTDLTVASDLRIVSDIFPSLGTQLTHLTLFRDVECITDRNTSHLTNLTYLYLNNDGITDKCIMRMTNLTDLSIEWNAVISDDGLWPLINLTTLSLSTNENILGYNMSRLVNLTELDISGNRHFEGEYLYTLTKLTNLSLLDNKKVVYYHIEHITSLKRLIISEKSAMNYEEVGALYQLKVLIFYGQTFTGEEKLRDHRHDLSIIRPDFVSSMVSDIVTYTAGGFAKIVDVVDYFK
jgi:hypothetical protein